MKKNEKFKTNKSICLKACQAKLKEWSLGISASCKQMVF